MANRLFTTHSVFRFMPYLHALSRGGVTSEFSHTILVVEDEGGLRTCVAEYLEECGFRVFEAGNVAEAKTVLNDDTTVDLVFSDVNMPGEETGFDLEKWLRLYRPQTKVILTSGDPHAVEKTECLHEPLMPKPYRYASMLRRIQSLL
jgi:DNA-binding NtrC family response regulator